MCPPQSDAIKKTALKKNPMREELIKMKNISDTEASSANYLNKSNNAESPRYQNRQTCKEEDDSGTSTTYSSMPKLEACPELCRCPNTRYSKNSRYHSS